MTNAGSRTVATAVATQPGQETVAASTSCLDQLCNILACKVGPHSLQHAGMTAQLQPWPSLAQPFAPDVLLALAFFWGI